MEKVTQGNADAADESHRSAQGLSQAAETLDGMVRQLQGLVGGNGHIGGNGHRALPLAPAAARPPVKMLTVSEVE